MLSNIVDSFFIWIHVNLFDSYKDDIILKILSPTFCLDSVSWTFPTSEHKDCISLRGEEFICNEGHTGDVGLISRWGRYLGEGNGNPLHILAWKIPSTEEPAGPKGCKESDTTATKHKTLMPNAVNMLSWTTRLNRFCEPCGMRLLPSWTNYSNLYKLISL